MFLDEHFIEDEREKYLQNTHQKRDYSTIDRSNDINHLNARLGTLSSIASNHQRSI
jgi:hypothetical protein